MPTKPTIQDQTFLFTGPLTEFTRDEAEALVEANGGKVISGVTAKLNFLVVGEDAGSKLDKAKKLGTVNILTEKEFLKMAPKGKGTVKKPAEEKVSKSTAAIKSASKESAKPATLKTAVNKISNAGAYEEVQIGKQIWMSKNLDATHFRNGDEIPEAKTNKAWKEASKNKQPAWCYYNNAVKNGNLYGKLYNWYAVIDPRGLAPLGWHVPSDDEWTTLTDHLGGEKNAGKKLKSASGWLDKGHGSNESGFSGLPGGSRQGYGHCFIDEYGFWWGSSEGSKDAASCLCLSYDNRSADRGIRYKEGGFSVRCLRD
jgi:uncharacterized protein (TIGR02145 family)